MVTTITEPQIPFIVPETRSFLVSIDYPFVILTHLTSNPDFVHEWIQRVWSRNYYSYATNTLVFGIAVQPSLLNNLYGATLTFCTGLDCLIIPLWRPLNGSDQLNFLFQDHSITYVCLSDSTDIRIRLTDFGLARDMDLNMPLNIRNFLDWFQGNESIPTIARALLGLSVEEADMGSEFSDWEAAELSLDQVRHATLEAFVPWLIGHEAEFWIGNPFFPLGPGN